MDPKDINNPRDIGNWQGLGFFSGDDYLVHIFKKTEKITAALYLVSGLLKDDEPMKWELRQRSIDMLASSFTASSSLPGDKNAVIQSLFASALETVSLLDVALISNLISEMNHDLLVHEIENVTGLLRERLAASAENAGYVLSEKFFKTDKESSEYRAPAVEASKGHENTRHPAHDISQQKKSKRQDNIIDILKGQSNLTIKDFSKAIKDCSEKTIQRELLEMVDKGLVKKEGERRWSRYSLK
jgi:hypothetical protein